MEVRFLRRLPRLILVCSLCICIMLTLLFGCTSQISETVNTYSKNNSILINEIMSSNSNYAQAQDGEFYDWVELYNNTDEDINLEGYYFSDSGTEPLRWSFPNITIKARSYLVVYLSGLDIWDGAYEVHTNFKLSSNGEHLILSHSSGDVLQQIDIPSIPRNVSYARDSESAEFLWCAVATPGAVNSSGSKNIDELEFPTYDIIINEYMSSNTYSFADSKGEHYDWVELYNRSLDDIDLTGFFLTDDRYNNMKWPFPSNTVIGSGEYLVIFCSGLDTVSDSGEIHSSFSLSGDDDLVCLYTPEGLLCSSLQICNLPEDVSTGISESGEQQLFARATPGKANTTFSYPVTSVLSADINDGVFISEAASVSGTRAKYSNDWIELFNSTDTEIDLTGYGLSTKEDIIEFTFPKTTIAPGGYLLVYCTGTEQSVAGKTLKTAFKLSNAGENIYLTNSLGRVVDTFSTGKQRNGISSGRDETAPSLRFFFTTPTPGKPNNMGTARSTYTAEPSFDTEAGYVKSGTVVNVSVPEGSYVVVTKDGSTPSSSGTAHYEDFSITVKKSTVLKAQAFSDCNLPSDVITTSFIVEKKHDIAVISLSSDPDGLFSYRSGILVDGPGYTEKLPHYGANYWKDWERSTHIEYITTDGELAVEFDCGIHTFGQYARGLPQKGLALILREKYGANEVSYPFFTDNDVASYKSLLLRPEGQDWNRAKLRDVLVPALIKNTHLTSVDYMDYTPVALYINGEYWGLYYLREKLNDNYVSYKYGYDKEDIDLIKSQAFVRAGSKAEYTALVKWVRKNSLRSAKNYEYFCSKVDIDSFIQFWIVQTYVCNHDTGNIRCYKGEDGKWRWMLYDFDWAFMISYASKDMIEAHMTDPEGHGAVNNMSNVMSRRLLNNSEFRKKFVREYIKALKYVFTPERAKEILNSLQATIKSEIPRQYDRWGHPSVTLQSNQVRNISRFFEKRSSYVKAHLKRHFKLSEKEFQRIWDSV